jgi:parallel beta-helix repeat protein
MLALGLGVMIFAGVIWVYAGNLNPPAGPVAPTMKPLDQVEPRTPVQSLPGSGSAVYVISQPGAYYLTGNITGVAGKYGIFVNADNVSLDLNGFAVIGVPSSADGIVDPGNSSPRQNVAVCNGAIQSWGGNGVNLAWTSNAAVTGLRLSGNGVAGVRVGDGGTVRNCACASNNSGIVTGQNAQVSDCIARYHTQGGISAATECSVSHCLTDFNGGDGIHTGADCTVQSSSSLQNTGSGIQAGNNSSVLDSRAVGNGNNGIGVGSGSLVRGCVGSSSSFHGIFISGGSSVEDCTAQFNGSVGVYISGGCTISRCTATSNNTGIGTQDNSGTGCTIAHCTASSNTSVGISANAGCHIADCTARNNLTGINVGSDCTVQSSTAVSNTGTGISVDGSGDTISGCTVNSNASTGISNNNADGGCLITGCTVELNGNSGIFVRKNCRVIENHCSRQTSGDGISVAGDGNHIEGNTCDDNTTGFAVQFLSGIDNVLLRNRSHGNTAPQYRFQGANASYGPIVDIAGLADITGTANANHPMANYRY